MSIICNTRCLDATLTGTQRYTQKILEGFPVDVQQIAPKKGTSRGTRGHVWEQFILPRKLNNELLWSPSNSGPINYSKQVVTIHDLVSVDHPEWFNKTYARWYKFMLPRLCSSAAHIIAISEFTRQRIQEVFNVPDSKITVIYNGANLVNNDHYLDSQPESALPFKRYVLSLGSLEPRKNIPLLISCWRNILHKIPGDVGLIIVGATGNQKIFRDAGIGDLPDRVYFTGHIDDNQVIRLYKEALCFVYLSAYEGFGLPPLEAISFGVPVLAGNKTSLPEVIGDAGLLVDTSSVNECSENLLSLITDEKLRSGLSERTTVQAAKFNWQRAAKQTWEVLKNFE